MTGQIPRISPEVSAQSIIRALADLLKEPPDYVTSTQQAAPLILSCSLWTFMYTSLPMPSLSVMPRSLLSDIFRLVIKPKIKALLLSFFSGVRR